LPRGSLNLGQSGFSQDLAAYPSSTKPFESTDEEMLYYSRRARKPEPVGWRQCTPRDPLRASIL